MSLEQCQVHAGEEDYARPGWTTSRRGPDSPWKSQSERQRTGINGESTSMVRQPWDRGRLENTKNSYVSAVLVMALCQSVHPSVTSRYSTKTAKRRITGTTPHDSPVTLVFWRQRFPQNSSGVTPCGGDKCRWAGQNRRLSTNNIGYISKTVQDAWFLLKSNRKSYALYRMVTLPMTLSDP